MLPTKRFPRTEQILLIASFLGFSWLAMQAVHEGGHVLGAVATGGRVNRVVLHPLRLSRTDVDPNPRPLAVVWAGPLVGALLPLAVFLLARRCRWPGLYLFRFFAGFCLVANGVYIGVGGFHGLADAGDMLRHGSPRWQLALFALATVPLGLRLWHGLGPRFGFVQAGGAVNRSATLVSLALFVFSFAILWAIAG